MKVNKYATESLETKVNQSRPYLYTLGPTVGINDVLGAQGLGDFGKKQNKTSTMLIWYMDQKPFSGSRTL